MSVTSPRKLIFANLVNELMTSVPAETHTRALSAVSPRKIWSAYRGDLVVTPEPIKGAFKEYAFGLLQLSESDVMLLTPEGGRKEYLATRLNDSSAKHQLEAWLKGPSVRYVQVFAMDRPTRNFLERYNLTTHYSNELPDDHAMKLLYTLNTKSGIREVFSELGLPMVPGRLCSGREDLYECTRAYLNSHESVLIKPDRGSNGYGHAILQRAQMESRGLESYVDEMIAPWVEQPSEYMLEKFENFVESPSVEILVTDRGYEITYSCNMRIVGNSFTGMVTPPVDVSDPIMKQLLHAGNVFGDYLFRNGYRGIADLDGAITAQGELVFTESNARRTGGTYIHDLLCRLIGADYLNRKYWLADAKFTGPSVQFVDGGNALVQSGLGWNSDTQTGAILTCDTLEIDCKWRYLIIADDPQQLSKLEHDVGKLLGAIGGSNAAS